MADLTPRTRSESFLNGEDLEPITRREHFYAGRENELPEGHQEPETREEWFIKKYREAGDVTVESLSITENGTYTAPSGKAYSPVSVNVPLPSNAYLLQSIEHESIATFADGTDNFVKSLEVAIEPQQEGSGEPSPTNIRPISGWDECKVTVADDLENPTVSNVYTIDLDGTRYGGKLDVVNGVLTVDRKFIDVSSMASSVGYNSGVGAGTLANTGLKANITSETLNEYISNCLKAHINSSVISMNYEFTLDANSGLLFKIPNCTSASDYQTWLGSNNLHIVGALATPQTIQLSPTIVKSLQGANNFFASTGEIELLQYWGEVS